MSVSIQMKLNEKLFLRDPQDTRLGKQIIEFGILLIDEIGFEGFTFKKLAERIGSTEASVYRYFENKHLFLVYLVSWYWEWMRYRIDIRLTNVQDPREKLKIAIQTLVDSTQASSSVSFVNSETLHRIVISEATKAYHVKNVDEENREGYYLSYKGLSHKLASIVKEIDPRFPYPNSLASNLLEMASHHLYFSRHLPSLTELKGEGDEEAQLVELLRFFSFGLLDRP
ncbi:MAG: TetR/AcrR family transcriptional regulator [Saprospirales bacterium]|jgi:AcrR family transcriptional regulator|nr:TetR/AcrR family transcriptional regulator [Saprospirales bacterium]MBK6902199.1 TetR/AcrR family transcriptional regulator [Saprospirales bacterium]MBK7337367.1 TetR/AcrR family transcriptional regulator [Saprospirales bacterium]